MSAVTMEWRERIAVAVIAATGWIGFSSFADEPPSLGDSVNLGPLADKHGDRGAEVFKRVCAPCHEKVASRAPSPAILSTMSPHAIVRILQAGVMQVQGQGISDPDKILVAEYLTKHKVADGSDHLSPPSCKSREAEFSFDQPPAFSGWGMTRTNTREVPIAVAGIDKGNLGKLHLKWALGLSGAIRVRSQPAIAGGAMYVGSQDGLVYALDMETGCARWRFQAPTEIRTGLVVSSWTAGDRSARPLVYFGDRANIYAIDARSGAEVWHVLADVHPITLLTAAPVLYKDRLYVSVASFEELGTSLKYECCTFRGSLVAYAARTGKELWRTFTIDQPAELQGVNSAGTKIFAPSGAGIFNPVAIDEKRAQLTFGTGDNYSRPTSATSDSVMAVDLNNGRIKWVYQGTSGDAWNTGCTWGHSEFCPKPEGPDFDFAAATILATASDGRDVVVAAEKSGFVFALDPDTGKLIWKTQVGRGGTSGGIEFGLAVRGNSVFVGVNDFDDGHAKYTELARPGLYALDLRTGQYLWQAKDSEETCRGLSRCYSGIYAAITTTQDLVFAGNNDGWFRIYDAKDGRVLWHYDMTQSVTTVGGGKAAGGSMGGPTAPIVYHGMLIVPSGWGMLQYIPGNVLLVFDTK